MAANKLDSRIIKLGTIMGLDTAIAGTMVADSTHTAVLRADIG